VKKQHSRYRKQLAISCNLHNYLLSYFFIESSNFDSQNIDITFHFKICYLNYSEDYSIYKTTQL